MTSSVYVWLPPEYRKNPDMQYPVLELLHGVPDSPGAWMAQMHVATRLTSAIERAAGETPADEKDFR